MDFFFFSERERQRDRETERQRDRETERQRQTDRQRDGETKRQRDRERDRETETEVLLVAYLIYLETVQSCGAILLIDLNGKQIVFIL